MVSRFDRGDPSQELQPRSVPAFRTATLFRDPGTRSSHSRDVASCNRVTSVRLGGTEIVVLSRSGVLAVTASRPTIVGRAAEAVVLPPPAFHLAFGGSSAPGPAPGLVALCIPAAAAWVKVIDTSAKPTAPVRGSTVVETIIAPDRPARVLHSPGHRRAERGPSRGAGPPFKALGDPIRMRLLSLITSHEGGEGGEVCAS